MTLSPLRGGPCSWTVSSPAIGESVELVSIEGLTIGASFDPSWQSATVTIKLLDPGHTITEDRLFASITERGDLFENDLITISYDSVKIWGGHCTSWTRDGEQVSLVLTGELSRVDKTFTRYTVPAESPKDALRSWMLGAVAEHLPALSYSDSFYRSYSQVAPAASTLSKWPAPLSYGETHLWSYTAELVGQYYQKTTHDLGTPGGSWIEISDFSPVPDPANTTLSSFEPLSWHRADSVLYCNARMGYTDSPGYGGRTPPANCDWISGRDQFFKVDSVKPWSSAAPDVSPAACEGAATEPESRQKTKVRTASIAEIVGKSIALGVTGVGWSQIPSYYKTVDQGVYKGSRSSTAAACWRKWHPGETAPDWVSEDPVMEPLTYSDVVLGKASTAKNQLLGASCSLSYTHPDTYGWTLSQSGVNAVEYSCRQTWTPVTVSQDPWTETSALEAAFLAGVCPIESYSLVRDRTGLHPAYVGFCDLLPETGEVWSIPLDLTTAGELSWQQDNPLPGEINCSYRDPLGRDCKITTNNFGPGDSSKSLTILQGSILSTDTFGTSHQPGTIEPWTYTTYTRGSNSWLNGPGQLLDRYSGVKYVNSQLKSIEAPAPNWQVQEQDSEGGIHYPGSAFELYGFSFLTSSGEVTGSPRSPLTRDPGLTEYKVRDLEGTELALFGQGLQVSTYDPVDSGLDFTPAYSMLRASSRVYSEPSRPSYSLTASMAFATAPIGQVVLLRHPGWRSGEPWLALILSKSFSSRSSGVSLSIVPMHAITDQDRQSWTGLSELLDCLDYDF